MRPSHGRQRKKGSRHKLVPFFLLGAIILVLLAYQGYFWPNRLIAYGYPVQGIDISHYQGEIDWALVARSGMKFAFIKATEGSAFKDERFLNNWNKSKKAGILRGAYHYFKTDSPGLAQAKNFISQVPVEKGCLPPVIDIEEGGVSKATFRKELGAFIQAIELRYGKKPILYVGYQWYNEYIAGNFEGYQIWISDQVAYPRLRDGTAWCFWQYYSRGRVGGINTFVDLDAFNGGMKDLQALLTS